MSECKNNIANDLDLFFGGWGALVPGVYFSTPNVKRSPRPHNLSINIPEGCWESGRHLSWSLISFFSSSLGMLNCASELASQPFFFLFFYFFFCYEEARFAPARKIFFFLKWEEEDRTARPLLYSICLYLLALFASLCSSVAFPRLHLRFGLFRPAPALSKTTIDAWLSGCQCLPVHALVQRRACLCVLDNYCVWMFILLLCTCGCEGQFPKAVAGAPPVDTHSHVCACSDMDRWPLDELYLLADMLVWKRLLLSFLISFSEYQGL